jgi:hypothetical protein
MIKITASLICVLNLLFLNAQSLNISNQSIVGSSGDDIIYIHPSPNGDGYYFIGESDGNTSFDKSEDSRGGYDIWIVKTDNNFVKQWDKTYGGNQDDNFTQAIVLDDRIIISSVSNSNTSGDKTMDLWGTPNIWNICIDLSGNLLWQFQYGGAGGESRNDMLALSDTSVLIAIETFSDISGNKTQNKYGGRDIWLVEAAISDGHIIQQNNIGSTGSEQFPKIVKSLLTNKVFMVTISGSGNVDNDKTDAGFLNNDIWLTEIDVNLNIVRDKCFGGNSFEDVPRITIDNSDNIIIGAKSNSGISGNKTTPLITTYFAGYDCWIVKLDVNFDIVWDKSYGGTQDQAILSMYPLSTGELVINCNSFSNQNTGNKTSEYYGGQDGWVLFLDVNGNDILQASFGGSAGDAAFTIKHPIDPSKVILCSPSNSPVSGNKTVAPKGNADAWIGILDYSTAGILSLHKNNSITAFPNPSQGSVSINFNLLNEASNLTFLTVDGRVLESVNLSENTDSYTWYADYKGVVFYALKSQNTQMQGKLIFE